MTTMTVASMANTCNVTSGMVGDAGKQSKEELTFSSFAALLSSAQLLGTEEPFLASEEPALTKLVSRNLPLFPAKSGDSGGSPVRCTLPSLKLKSGSSKPPTKDISPQESAAMNLSTPVFMTREEIASAPVSLLNNISDSFMTLVESRLKSSVAALRKTFESMFVGAGDIGSFGNGVGSEALAVINLLTQSPFYSPIKTTTVVTSFRTLPPPSPVEGQAGVAKEIILPLIFEAVIDLDVFGSLGDNTVDSQDNMITVAIRAPGTVAGTLHPVDSLVDSVEMSIDSAALLEAMMKQAKKVVNKTMAVAAGIASSKSASNNSAANLNVAAAAAVANNAGLSLASHRGSAAGLTAGLSSCSSLASLNFSPSPLEQFTRASASSASDGRVGHLGLSFQQQQQRLFSLGADLDAAALRDQIQSQSQEEQPLPRRLSNLSEYQPEEAEPNKLADSNASDDGGALSQKRNAEFPFFQSMAPWMTNSNIWENNSAPPKPSNGNLNGLNLSSCVLPSSNQVDLNNFPSGGADEAKTLKLASHEPVKQESAEVDDLTLAPSISIKDLFSKLQAEHQAAQLQRKHQIQHVDAHDLEHVQKKKRVSFGSLCVPTKSAS